MDYRSNQPPPNHTHLNGPGPFREAEYIFFERSVAGFRKETLEKAQAAKLKLEHFYQKAVQEAIERNARQALLTFNCSYCQSDSPIGCGVHDASSIVSCAITATPAQAVGVAGRERKSYSICNDERGGRGMNGRREMTGQHDPRYMTAGGGYWLADA